MEKFELLNNKKIGETAIEEEANLDKEEDFYKKRTEFFKTKIIKINSQINLYQNELDKILESSFGPLPLSVEQEAMLKRAKDLIQADIFVLKTRLNKLIKKRKKINNLEFINAKNISEKSSNN